LDHAVRWERMAAAPECGDGERDDDHPHRPLS
jgi:hypothetical protein